MSWENIPWQLFIEQLPRRNLGTRTHELHKFIFKEDLIKNFLRNRPCILWLFCYILDSYAKYELKITHDNLVSVISTIVILSIVIDGSKAALHSFSHCIVEFWTKLVSHEKSRPMFLLYDLTCWILQWNIHMRANII